MKVSYINNYTEVFPYIMDKGGYESTEELWRACNILVGPIETIATNYKLLGSYPIYTGNVAYYNMGYLFNKILKIPQMNTLLFQKSLFGGGKGTKIWEMINGSIGEIIERVIGSYAYLMYHNEMLFGSYSELTSGGINCLSPDEMGLFHEEQYKLSNFPYKPFTKNTLLKWIKGKKLVSGKEIWAPAQLVMMVYFKHPKEDMIGYATSGGLSANVNIYETIYHGCCELIERDAVNLRWHCGIPPLEIFISEDELFNYNEDFLNLIKCRQKYPSEIKLYYHSLDITEVSVVTAIEINREFKKYMYYPGGGADINIQIAIIKALKEFAQAQNSFKSALLIKEREYNKALFQMFDISGDTPVSKIDNFIKIVAWYGNSKNIDKLNWYLNNNEKINLKSLPSVDLKESKLKYEFILRAMEKHNIDPIFFDFTPLFFKSLKLIKIFIPEITFPSLPSLIYLGHPRYFECGKKFHNKKKFNFEDLIKEPLPYP